MIKVILLEKVKNLGGVGDTVNVKPGFARNFLLPQHKAVRATEENLKVFEARRAEYEKNAEEALKAAQARAEQIAVLEIVIPAKAGDEGKLFGSIGTRDIANAVTAAGVEILKSQVLLPNGSIRQTGEYQIELQLHSDVTGVAKVSVVEAK